MLKYFKNLLQAPTFNDQEQTRLARLLHSITLGVWLVPISTLIISLLFPSLAPSGILVTILVFVVNVIVSILSMRGANRSASTILVIALIGTITYVSISLAGQPRPYILFFTWIIAVAGLLLGGKAASFTAIYFAILQSTVIILVNTGIIQEVNAPSSPLGNIVVFTASFLLISSTFNLAYSSIQSLYKQGRVNELELENSNKELTELTNTLEKRIADRTSEIERANTRIEKRAKQFQAISQVTRAIISTQNLQDILPQIAQVISQQFGFYHIGIFMIDPKREYAVLSASNSDGGEKMLARSHKLRVGQVGIVGNVAKTGKVRIALDAGADAVYFNNPDLPETRSEMALPLSQANGQIIGVLDIQSTEPNAFLQEDIEILTTLADQVSVAITNARLYEDTQKALIEAEMVYRQDIKMGWSKFARSQNLAGIRRRSMKSNFLLEPLEIPGAVEVTRFGSIFQRKADNKNNSTQLTMPMKLRGEVVGVLNLKTNKDREWSPDEIDIITAIIDRTALAIENARLLQDAQKRASKEQVIGQISAKIGSLVGIENIIKTTVQELGNTLPGTDIAIQFKKNQETE